MNIEHKLILPKFVILAIVFILVSSPVQSSKANFMYQIDVEEGVEAIILTGNFDSLSPSYIYITTTCKLVDAAELNNEIDQNNPNVLNINNDSNAVRMYSAPSLIKANILYDQTVAGSKKLKNDSNEVTCHVNDSLKPGKYWFHFGINFVEIDSNDAQFENFSRNTSIKTVSKKIMKTVIPSNQRTITQQNITNANFRTMNSTRILEENFAETETKFGYNLIVEKDYKTIGMGLLKKGTWCDGLVYAMATLIEPGNTVFNMGGHMGTYQVLLSDLVGKTGKVLTYEPMMRTFSVLERNVNNSHRNNVKLINKGVSDKNEKSQIMYKNDRTGAAFLVSQNSKKLKEANITVNNVTLIRLDEEEHALAAGKPDFILIDIEGMECMAFEGYKKYLENNNIPFVMEFGIGKLNPEDSDNICNKMLAYYREHYLLYVIDKFNKVYTKYSVDNIYNHGVKGWHDVLFIPKDYASNNTKKLDYLNSMSVILSPTTEIYKFVRIAEKINPVLVEVDAITDELFLYIQMKREVIEKQGMSVVIIAKDSRVCSIIENENICGKMRNYKKINLADLMKELDVNEKIEKINDRYDNREKTDI